MIGIATITNNAEGDIVIHEKPESDLDTSEVRVSRTATLDGGSVIDVQGYSDGDRTLQVVADLTAADTERLFRIFKIGSYVYVATAEGFFKGVISRIVPDGGNVNLQILISERLSA